MMTRAREMKRKAAPGPASEQRANKLTSCKGKEVAGIPVDTDQEAHEVLRATAPSQKAMTPQPGSFGQHLLKGFAALWNERDEGADVILTVGDQQVPAHSCVLCVWSEEFKVLLQPWSGQATDNGVAAVVVELTQGDSPEDFLEVLHYCYVGTCRLDSHNVMPLLRLSFYYVILPLKESCGELLFELLTARKCLNLLLELTERYVCTRAWRMLIQHVAHNFEALLEEGALWQLPCRVWEEVLIQDCLAVASEAAVLSAIRRYAQLQDSHASRYLAMDMLLPCVRLPQMGVTTLLASVEQDKWLMGFTVTKEYLANAFRCMLLTKEGKAAKPLAVAGSAAGPSSLGGSDAALYNAHMREVTMQLQGRPRRPPPSFTSPHPEGHSLGFLLERGRCTATAQAEGGMKIAFVEEAVGRRSRLVFGPAPDAPRSCYTVVQPGLQSGSTYTELLVQSMRPSSRGTSGLRFWVVRAPRVQPPSFPVDDQDVSLVWDWYGTVYGRASDLAGNGHMPTHGGRVHHVASCETLGVEDFLQPPTRCEGFSQGDIIGVGMRTAGLPADRGNQMPPGRPQHQTREQSVTITFHKNGRLMAKHTLSSPCKIHKGEPNGHWHVMVSSSTPGDSVQLLRPPPTQAAKPGTTRVPEAAQPAAQLDAESQAQRRTAALEELMTDMGPHDRDPVRPYAAALSVEEMHDMIDEHVGLELDRLRQQERQARLRRIHPEGGEMGGPPGLGGRQPPEWEEPGWTDEEEGGYPDEEDYMDEGPSEEEFERVVTDGWRDLEREEEERRQAMRTGAPDHPGVPI